MRYDTRYRSSNYSSYLPAGVKWLLIANVGMFLLYSLILVFNTYSSFLSVVFLFIFCHSSFLSFFLSIFLLCFKFWTSSLYFIPFILIS